MRMAALTAVALAALSVAPSHAAPANDSFAAARSVAVPGVYAGTTAAASTQVQEPLGCAQARTVWYRFSVPRATPVTVHVRQSAWAFDPWVAVYRGSSLASLTSLGCAIAGPIALTAQPGTDYYVQVGTHGSAAGPFKLSVGVGAAASSLGFAGYAYTDGSGVDMVAIVYAIVGGAGVGAAYRPSEGGYAGACVFWFLAGLCLTPALPRPPGP